MRNSFLLNRNWKLYIDNDRQNIPDGFAFPEEGIPAEIPGTVHTDLLNAGLIPDPFYGDNELHLQWIAEVDWRYESRFDFPADFNETDDYNLVFEGLDTIADVRLNGQTVLSAENMFTAYRVNIKRLLREKENHLIIKFPSPMAYLRKTSQPLPQSSGIPNADRVYIRKAQYSFGWDWGPALVTSGIWRPVYLEKMPKASIRSLYFETLQIDKNRAEILLRCQVECPADTSYNLDINLSHGADAFREKIKTDGRENIEIKMIIPHPKLWWPAGHGSPDLYDLQIDLLDSANTIVDRVNRKVGIRTIRLQLEENGKPAFRFIINGKAVFIKGANWIPADSFLPRVTGEKYKQLINMVVKANMNTLRVWGGGIYEDDYFYRLCDENGLLIWQDFMFACASYPENDTFIQNVKKELQYNISRLQTHPCVIIWCGNNENEWLWYRDQSAQLKEMPGYNLFHKFFPEWLKAWDPSRPYWPSSPFGNDEDPNDPASGNRHQWDIWSMWIDYTEVIHDKSLFVTEFGFQGPANLHTFLKAIPPEQLHPQSRMFEFHNKQEEGPERLIKFLNAHFPVKTDMDSFIYLTQLNQGLALKTCLEHWINRWPETSGSIIWQINDCWPVTSWSLIDSDLKPKLAYYFVKKAFAPINISFVQRQNDFSVIIRVAEQPDYPIEWRLLEISPAGEIRKIAGEIIKRRLPGDKINLYTLESRGMNPDMVYLARLYQYENGKTLAETCLPGRQWKHMTLPKGNLKTSIDKGMLKITADFPVFFVCLSHESKVFAENGFCLLSGEEINTPVSLPREKTKEININYLNRYCI
ncbi:MAG: glycoside hydrolase family 2 protein [Calditrichaceae bacterium]|nr:glycoside hydrolase family 2 protein [Calditrichaceae bacterium]